MAHDSAPSYYIVLEDCRRTPVSTYVGERGTLGPYTFLEDARRHADKYTVEGCSRAHIVQLVETWPEASPWRPKAA
jgi:hypothetical protein